MTHFRFISFLNLWLQKAMVRDTFEKYALGFNCATDHVCGSLSQLRLEAVPKFKKFSYEEVNTKCLY